MIWVSVSLPLDVSYDQEPLQKIIKGNSEISPEQVRKGSSPNKFRKSLQIKTDDEDDTIFGLELQNEDQNGINSTNVQNNKDNTILSRLEHPQVKYGSKNETVEEKLPNFFENANIYRNIDTSHQMITEEFILSNSDILEKKNTTLNFSISNSDLMLSRFSAFGNSLIKSDITNQSALGNSMMKSDQINQSSITVSHKNNYFSETEGLVGQRKLEISEVSEKLEDTINSDRRATVLNEIREQMKDTINRSVDMSTVRVESPDNKTFTSIAFKEIDNRLFLPALESIKGINNRDEMIDDQEEQKQISDTQQNNSSNSNNTDTPQIPSDISQHSVKYMSVSKNLTNT